jgi:hypothetical protein
MSDLPTLQSEPQVLEEVCVSKWPGSNTYRLVFGNGQPIAKFNVSLTRQEDRGADYVSDGELINDDRNVFVYVAMHEGDMFSPNKHKVTIQARIWYK